MVLVFIQKNIKKIFKKIKTKIKNWKVSRELWKSHGGRDYGWYIEFEGEIIGELVDCEYVEMFWEKYKVISKDKKWDSYLFDEKLWFEENAFKFKNKHYNLYAPYAFSGGGYDLKSKHQIHMRRLYLIELD